MRLHHKFCLRFRLLLARKLSRQPTIFCATKKTSTMATVRKKRWKVTHIELPRKKITIGTWNVRTLNQRGKLKQLTYAALDKYKLDIIRLS